MVVPNVGWSDGRFVVGLTVVDCIWMASDVVFGIYDDVVDDLRLDDVVVVKYSGGFVGACVSTGNGAVLVDTDVVNTGGNVV